jgi:hypothetical protein
MENYNWGRGCNGCETDHGPKPFVTNIMRVARQNQNFRTAFWTGCHLQMTLMCIPPCGEIGVEMHPDTDQFIRVEEGQALVRMGDCRENLDFQCRIGTGDAIFVPGGTWHNVFNTGNGPLKLSSFYAPPQHPKGTIHRTKADSENKEH